MSHQRCYILQSKPKNSKIPWKLVNDNKAAEGQVSHDGMPCGNQYRPHQWSQTSHDVPHNRVSISVPSFTIPMMCRSLRESPNRFWSFRNGYCQQQRLFPYQLRVPQQVNVLQYEKEDSTALLKFDWLHSLVILCSFLCLNVVQNTVIHITAKFALNLARNRLGRNFQHMGITIWIVLKLLSFFLTHQLVNTDQPKLFQDTAVEATFLSIAKTNIKA